MARVGLLGTGLSVVLLGSGAANAAPPCVDMLALGEPVCDIATGELELATSVDLAREDGTSAFATGFDLQVALTDWATAAVRIETDVDLHDGTPAMSGVGGHLFGILLRSEDGARGLGLAVDVLAPNEGAPVAEVGVGTTFSWRAAALSAATGITAPLEGELPANGFGSASLAVPFGPLALAALVEARVEGGADPLRLDMAVGITLHPSESTKLLVAAPVGHGEAGWSAGVAVTFAAGLGTIGGDHEPAFVAADEAAPVVVATDVP